MLEGHQRLLKVTASLLNLSPLEKCLPFLKEVPGQFNQQPDGIFLFNNRLQGRLTGQGFRRGYLKDRWRQRVSPAGYRLRRDIAARAASCNQQQPAQRPQLVLIFACTDAKYPTLRNGTQRFSYCFAILLLWVRAEASGRSSIALNTCESTSRATLKLSSSPNRFRNSLCWSLFQSLGGSLQNSGP